MKNQFNINITSPCDENYDNFTPTSKGGFCNTCTKEVIDFTAMDSEDIITFFNSKNSKNTCGRFKPSQLKTYNMPLQRRSYKSMITALAMAFLGLFAFQKSQAQNTNNNNINPINLQGDYQTKTVTVKGTVKENGMPLPGVDIYLAGTAIGTTTDFEGNFEFPQKLKQGDVLIFNYVGFKTQRISINTITNPMHIALDLNLKELDEIVIVGKVATKKVYKSKQD
jgi:hypothetical protein